MSITRFTSVLAALVTALAFATSAEAQLFKPFAFPEIESDFQFFAPADIETFGGRPEHNTGWFATYDRVYMNMQRPNDAFQFASKMGDFTWGNRIELGFVDDDSKGWLATIWHVDGPNANDVVLTERINRFNSNGAPQNPAVQPRRDNNLRLTGDRDYLVTNSINVADMTGFELNRTWLNTSMMHGARLQPLAGFRYIRFIDFYQRQAYVRMDDNGAIVPPTPPITGLTATTEQLNSIDAGFVNDMVGGQLGIRWQKDYRRWNFSGDVKGFALQNFQKHNIVNTSTTTIYPGALSQEDATPDTVAIERSGSGGHSAQFVFGMEARAEAAYKVTRDLSLKVGFEFLDLGTGIGRGVNPLDNRQAVIMYGVTVGAALNR